MGDERQRVYVEPTGRRVAPFDDPVSDVLIGNRPLSAWQQDAIRDAGLARVEVLEPPCLVIPDTLFTSGAVLRRFVDEAHGRDAVLVLAPSVFGRDTTPVQPGVDPVDGDGGWRFTAVRWVTDRGELPVDVVIDPEEYVHTLALPEVFGGPAKIALPRHPVMTVHHWVHLVWAGTACASMVTRRVPRWLAILRIVWAIVRARSVNFWRVLGRLNTIGRGCNIHPTAVVEASTLGNNVTVGPYARVLFSTVGDGATILSGAEVEASTIGEGATVGQRCGLRLCVIYPHAMASQILMQACVLGQRTITVPGSYSIDLNFDHDVNVLLDGRLWSTGSRFLGSAFGHDCRIGTGIWLASGRSIPNRTVLVRDPGGVIAKVGPIVAGEPAVNDRGVLRPLARAAPTEADPGAVAGGVGVVDPTPREEGTG